MLRLAQEELQREKEMMEEELSHVDYVTATHESYCTEGSAASFAESRTIEDVDIEQLVHEPAITFYTYSGDSAEVNSKPFYRSRKFTTNQEGEELWN